MIHQERGRIDLPPSVPRSGGVVVLGTDTEVGKTVVAARLIRQWRGEGRRVLPMKPAVSDCASRDGRLVSEDLDCLLSAAGFAGESEAGEIAEWAAPFRYELPLAPLPAARREGRPAPARQRILECYRNLRERAEVVVVEGIGGALVPLDTDFYAADLPALLDLPALIVARIGLGTLNHTLLTIEALRRRDVNILGVVFNNPTGRITPSDEDNPVLIAELSGLPVLGVLPYQGESA